MGQKVLLADDSLTIQKVIKITLANEPYELSSCDSAEQLFKKLGDEKPALVLLDFALSSQESGYDLTKKIKSTDSNIQVLIMFGTFDHIDHNALVESGAADKIIKPFDSYQLVSLCKKLVPIDSGEDDEGDGPMGQEQPKDSEPTLPSAISRPKGVDETQVGVQQVPEKLKQDPEEAWMVQSGASPEFDPDETVKDYDLSAFHKQQSLESEMKDWGFEVPPMMGRNNASEITSELPAVIPGTGSSESTKELKSTEESAPETPQMPSGNDSLSPKSDGSSKLPPKAVPKKNDEEKAYQSQALDQLDNEIGDDDLEDFWKVDKEASPDSVESKPLQSSFQTDTMIKAIKKESPEKIEQQNNLSEKIDYDLLAEKVSEKMRPQIEALAERLSKEVTERVAWEVIPELAENVIKGELERLSKDLLEEEHQSDQGASQ